MKPGSFNELRRQQTVRIREKQRETKLLKLFEKLAERPEDERRWRLKRMITEVYSQDDARVRAFMNSRLRVWTRIDQQLANTLLASYDRVMEQMPADVAMKQVFLSARQLKS